MKMGGARHACGASSVDPAQARLHGGDLVRRRDFLGKAAVAGAGVVAGAGILQGLNDVGVLRTEPAGWASTVQPELERGNATIWWSADPSVGRKVALTFDDGPTTQFTARVLDVLAGAGASATFFVVGELARRHRDLLLRIHDAGHEIGNHTDDHVSAAASDHTHVRDAVLRCSDTIQQLTGRHPRWFRPPRGEVTTASLLAAREAQLDVAMWSLGRGDASDADSEGVARHLLTALHPGALVDLHDGIGRSSWAGSPDHQLIRRRTAEITALPQVLAGWKEQGYTFTGLSQLLLATGPPSPSPPSSSSSSSSPSP
jgi:peptidoglycan/xylan/chitin deacetylase (PgdA/CDA1 family)